MIESIHVGVTGLLGYSRGLRVIANNTANINTPGFKSSSLQFSDLYYSRGDFNSGAGGQIGYGLNTNGTRLSFKQGELRQTGNDLDMAVDGTGLFTLKDGAGKITYTRAGQFQFNSDGVLVDKGTGAKVLGLDGSSNLAEISIAGLKTNGGNATSTLNLNGNLSSTAVDQTVSSVKVFDSLGGEHTLSIKLTNTSTTAPGSWRVDLLEGTSVVGSGQLVFVNGRPTAASANVGITYTPSGLPAIPLTLSFGQDVTSFASGNLSTLAVASQNGYAPGALSRVAFDTAGALVLTYSNGQTAKGNRLALGRFDSIESVLAVGDNQFQASDGRGWHIGGAGDGAFGSVRSGLVEISNVDLSREFSDLVVMQRGYQASSQVISTANEMLQQLFAMKGQ